MAIATEFLAGSKHGLLAPYGVGTIDQLFLAVLNTKHHFVRLYGIARKTVILDEVHAYDTYMNELLKRLVQWLRAMDCTVVVLSATLPRKRRLELLSAWDATVVEESTYPRVTVVDGERCAREHRVEARTLPAVSLDWVGSERAIARAIEAASQGGCVAVIRNTVDGAQETFREIASRLGESRIDLRLFHARYPYEDRQEIETGCLLAYGPPNGEYQGQPVVRPAGGSILVATQVVEQSLDLDFDLMVSEVAPIDLLIQRAGRLHRHERDERGPSDVDAR